jgi:ribosomal protein S18 acetylase RimI-like enzyme
VADVDYEIVTAKSGDVGALVRLISALFREDAGERDPFTDLGWSAAHGRDHFLSLITQNDALCLLAKSGPTPVGYLAGYVREPTEVRPVRVAELQSMYVEAASRNRGVGSGLVDEFLSWAEAHGAERVSVTAYASNDAALRFYARCGFRPLSATLEMPLE